MKQYHYVYIISNLINGKFYIGKHSTDNLEDEYMGSGIAIKRAIKKYGILNFKKRIICYCDTQEDALKVEEFLVTEYIVNRDDCYNMKCGGKGGSEKGRKLSDSTKAKISKAQLGNLYSKGHKMSDDLKKLISATNKGSKHMLGTKLSDVTRKKMSDSHKGKHWFTNGTLDILSAMCPDGFVPGRTVKKKLK